MTNYLAEARPFKALIFELDDVLYPQKDYLLQVYFLFAQFLEYTETYPRADELIRFSKKAYEAKGPEGLFSKMQQAFGIDSKYSENFDRLHLKAKLPLKLLLFDEMLALLKEAASEGKTIFIATSGNPDMQLNKIKQVEWNGLEKHIQVYFCDEIRLKPQPDTLFKLMADNDLKPEDVVLFGRGDSDRQFAENSGIHFVQLDFN